MSASRQEERFLQERQAMVRDQIEKRGIHSTLTLDALRTVPRHLFVPEGQQHWAYSDGALRIGQGQTISQPYIVALMTDLLHLKGDERILEIGTGSGYQAAILAHLAAEVHTIERHAPLSTQAKQVFETLEITNASFYIRDGSKGLPEQAPFDGIMVTAAAPQVPENLLEQLVDGGRLVIPVGRRFSQVLEVWHRREEKFEQDSITAVAFVPLIGEQGWPDSGEDRNLKW